MLKATHPGLLKISGLQEGIYTFQMTVTDTAGQKSSDNVSVTVLAPKHQAEGDGFKEHAALLCSFVSSLLVISSKIQGYCVMWKWTTYTSLQTEEKWRDDAITKKRRWLLLLSDEYNLVLIFLIVSFSAHSVYWSLFKLPVQVWWRLLYWHHICLWWEAALSRPLWWRLLPKL